LGQKLKPGDEKYQEIVEIKGGENFDIDVSKLEPGDEIECPSDKNMHIEKNSDGSIKLKKKTHDTKPFLGKCST